MVDLLRSPHQAPNWSLSSWTRAMNQHRAYQHPGKGNSSFAPHRRHLRSRVLQISQHIFIYDLIKGTCGAVVGGATATLMWSRSLRPWSTKPSIPPGSANWYQTWPDMHSITSNDA
uniref:Uncharacterized protein n=1 Tax=Angiostrongylus cantonensis TaxID=6313 RepID=A0A0K0D0T9_ANGCA